MVSTDTNVALAGLKPQAMESTPFARAYSHVHSVLVLSLYYTRFGATVQDPVSSLLQLLAPVAGLQIIYSIICIPTLSTPSLRSSKPSGTQPQTLKKPKVSKGSDGLVKKIFPAILSAILSTAIATPLLFVLIVLHGAPVTSHTLHTALTALHLSLLATLPLFFANGVSSTPWRNIVGLMAPVDELFGAALGACVGAWAGAVPIPLDWDREWQKWPVTIVYGVVAGWAAGKLLGGTVAHGYKIKLDK